MNKIKAIRKFFAYTQKELAGICGVSQATISRMETEKVSIEKIIDKLVRNLQVREAWLLGIDSKMMRDYENPSWLIESFDDLMADCHTTTGKSLNEKQQVPASEARKQRTASCQLGY